MQAMRGQVVAQRQACCAPPLTVTTHHIPSTFASVAYPAPRRQPHRFVCCAQQQQSNLPLPSKDAAQNEAATSEEEEGAESDDDAAPTTSTPEDRNTLLLGIYRLSVRIIVYSTAIVLGMGSKTIMQTWLKAAVFLTVTMGLCIRDTWGLWEKFNKPKRIAPHVAMLDACTVLFVAANALAIGLISANVLEIIGNALGWWLLCALHFDYDMWPFDGQRRSTRPQQPRRDPATTTTAGAAGIVLDRKEYWMVATAVLCAGISVCVVCHLFDVYTTALANEEVVSRIARNIAASLKR